jgi:predicted Zn-dependent protease
MRISVYATLSLIVLVTSMLFYPVLSEGFATELNLSDCQCKWYKSKLVVWIDNQSELRNTSLVIDAINEWQRNFTKLYYEIHTISPSDYDIAITIHKTYGYATGLPRETIGFTTNEKKPHTNELVQVTIDVPTHYRNSYGSITKIKDDVFYNMVLHELGHGLGLGHAVDNRKAPLDPMYHKLRIDEPARQVSALDLSTLEKLYTHLPELDD